MRLSKRIILPPGECRGEIRLMRDIAKKLGLTGKWLTENEWDAVSKVLAGAFEEGGIDELMAGKTLKLKLKSPDIYQTPSGKIEFYSSRALEIGLNAVPEVHSVNQEDGTFVLLNSSLSRYTHTQFQEVFGKIPAIVHINPVDAEMIGIETSDTVVLYNDLGEVTVKAIVTTSVSRSTLWSPKLLTGIDGNPLNVLSSNKTQLIGGGSAFNSIQVKIRKRD
ncbi:MAG: molybdopterin dinucleotide binding domain-containing protein [Candidatus Hodarchaeales archaeon]